jgi:flagellum-specific peptidoglycan hydrolase FlgJ
MPRSVPAKSSVKTIYTAWVSVARTWIAGQLRTMSSWVNQNWFRLLIIGLLTFILLRKDVSLQLDLENGQSRIPIEQKYEWMGHQPEKVSIHTIADGPVLSAKTEQQLAYVKRFARVAQKEMGEFGIPASITLAQGLLETDAGNSPLASKHNNHFGLKCFSRTCKKGHCTNFSDDSHKDFFRRFSSAWESYRAHSLLLAKSDRYRELFQLPQTDYEAWAKGLKQAGYATDRAYADKLIRLIERLRLHEYDV